MAIVTTKKFALKNHNDFPDNKNIDKKYSKSLEYKGPKSSTVFCNENTLKILFKKMIKIKIIVN